MIYTFYLLATILTVSSVLVVSLKNPVYNLLSLLLCFFSLSAIFLLLNAEMIAMFILLIYTVGLAIIFVFVLMTIRLDSIGNKNLSKFSIFSAGIIFSEVTSIIMLKLKDQPSLLLTEIQQKTSLEVSLELAKALFTDYSYLVIILGFTLIVGMVGSVTLIYKPSNRKLKIIHSKELPLELKSVKSKQGVDIC
ncbi:MAG: hypothetical protein GY793_06180 [Proteobacteria bacterium]|nr:hypothetical protein [Pseudomonadota bacterium]